MKNIDLILLFGIGTLIIYLLEWLLSYYWNDRYFRFGLPIYSRNIKAKKPLLTNFGAKELQKKYERIFKNSFIFKIADSKTIFFRKDFCFRGMHSPATEILRGKISQVNNTVRVTGYINYISLTSNLFILYLLSEIPNFWPRIFLVFVLLLSLLRSAFQFNNLIKVSTTMYFFCRDHEEL